MFANTLHTWLFAISFLSTAISAIPAPSSPSQEAEGYGETITITSTTFISVIGSTCPTVPTTTLFSYVPAATTTVTTTTTTSICPACTADEGLPKGGPGRKQADSKPAENIPPPPPAPLELLPAVPAHVDLKNLSNLTPWKDCTVYYEGQSEEQGTSGAYVTFQDLTYAAVVLEHTAYVSQISCSTATQISVTFSDKAAFDHAFAAWTAAIPTKFVLVTYAPTCGTGQDGERDFLLVSALSKSGALTITATIKKISLEDAAGVVEVSFGQAVAPGNGNTTAVAARATPLPYNPDYELSPRSFWGKIGNAFKKAADTVVKGIDKVVNTVTNAVVDVVNDVIPPLALGPFSFSAYPGTQVSTPFGPGVLLFQTTKPLASAAKNTTLKPRISTSTSASASASLTGYCVGCGVNGTLSLTGSVKFSATEGIASATFALAGDMHAQIALGIVGELDASANAQVNIITVSLSPLQIPGIVSVGPSVGLDVGATVDMKLVGEMEVGYAFDWLAIHAELDILHPQNAVATGFTPTATPIFRADAALTVDASIFALLGIRLGIDVLSGKFSAGVGLVDKPSIDATATAHGELTTGKDGFPDGGGCGGAGFTVGVKDVLFVEAGAQALGLAQATTTWPIGSWSQNLFSTSISGCASPAAATPHPTTVVATTVVVGTGLPKKEQVAGRPLYGNSTMTAGGGPTAASKTLSPYHPSLANGTTTRVGPTAPSQTLPPYHGQPVVSTTALVSVFAENGTTTTRTTTMSSAPVINTPLISYGNLTSTSTSSTSTISTSSSSSTSTSNPTTTPPPYQNTTTYQNRARNLLARREGELGMRGAVPLS